MIALKKTIWLSYDLGATGDYEGMYAWLDNKKAKECGSGLAVFEYHYKGDLPEFLKRDISEAVSLNKRSRIYVIFREEGKTRGRYLTGKRRGAPWTGFGEHGEVQDDGI